MKLTDLARLKPCGFRGWSFLAGGLGLAFVTSCCAAEIPPPVFVHTSSKDGNGQGFLLTRMTNCLAVTAAHVMGERTRAIVVGGSDRQLVGDAVLVGADRTADIAVLRVSGALERQCGKDFVAPLDPARLRTNGLAVRSYVSEDGSVSREGLIVADVGPDDIMVAPPAGQPPLEKGFSGSLIAIDDSPAAMMLEVDNVRKEGVSRRYDRILPVVRRLADAGLSFAGPPAATAEPTVTPMSNLASFRRGARTIAWSTRPLTPENSAVNLVDEESTTPWRVSVFKGSADVTIELAGSRVWTVTQVEANVAQVPHDEWPQSWEALVSVDQRTWALVANGAFAPVDGIARLVLPPSRARWIRVIVYGHPPNQGVVSVAHLVVH